MEKALLRQLDMLPAGASAISDFSHHIDLSVEKAWMLASVRYGDNKIRSGWLLLALLTTPELVSGTEQYLARRWPRFRLMN